MDTKITPLPVLYDPVKLYTYSEWINPIKDIDTVIKAYQYAAAARTYWLVRCSMRTVQADEYLINLAARFDLKDKMQIVLTVADDFSKAPPEWRVTQ